LTNNIAQVLIFIGNEKMENLMYNIAVVLK